MNKAEHTNRRTLAARLVAEDLLDDVDIAKQAGICRTTLHNWKKTPDFQALVKDHIDRQFAAVAAVGIANKQQRVLALHDRWQRMRRVMAARANDPAVANVPGGTTGTIVKQIKNVGGCPVEEYAVDVGLMKELRETEKQAAQELGQWVEKSETKADVDLDAAGDSLTRKLDALRADLGRSLPGEPDPPRA